MEKYESKQVQIRRPAALIYESLADFSRFTPLIQDKVEGWSADSDHCTFKVSGFTVGLRIVERDPYTLIKIKGDEAAPFEFTFWLQLKEIAPDDTRMRLVLHVKLNMMMKMMLGGKLRDGLDKMAEQIAAGFNSAPIPPMAGYPAS